MHLDSEMLRQYIPHRDAMLFTHQVSVLAHNHYTGLAAWKADSFVFSGHFPGQPIVPGVMLIEAAAQIAGVGLCATDPLAQSIAKTNLGFLAGIRKCFFRRPVPPGLEIRYELRTRQMAKGVVDVSGEASCAYGSVAELQFLFAQASEGSVSMLLSQAAA